MNIEIANRLAALRKQRGLSQEELADRLGLSRQAISKWERAESSPDTDNLIALARLYKISLDELLALHIAPDADDAATPQPSAQPDPSEAEWEAIQPVVIPGAPDTPGAPPPQSAEEEAVAPAAPGQFGRAGIRWSVFPYPLLVTAVFLVTGFFWHMWHPGWMLFLTIPIYYTALRGNRFDLNRVPFPLVVVPLYLALGYAFNLWHPGWMVFLTIPLYYGFKSALPDLHIDIPVILGGAAALVVMGFAFGSDRVVWLILVCVGLALAAVLNRRDGDDAA